MQTLSWEKDIWQSVYKLKTEKEGLGQLNNNLFNDQAYFQINNQQYLISGNAGFSRKNKITNSNTGELIGCITKNFWITQGTIDLNGGTYFWSFKNFLASKLIIEGNNEQLILNRKNSRGTIETTSDTIILNILGLYILDAYQQLLILGVINLLLVAFFLFN